MADGEALCLEVEFHTSEESLPGGSGVRVEGHRACLTISRVARQEGQGLVALQQAFPLCSGSLVSDFLDLCLQ